MSFRISCGGIQAADPADVDRWRGQFADQHCARITGLIAPPLLAWLRRPLDDAVVERIHRNLTPPAVDLALADDRLHSMLFMLTNDRALFEVIRAISGCDPIGCYWPVVYRMEPRAAHHDTWHDDLDGNRMVAMSVNLGDRYEGGVLQLRERDTGRIVHEVANTGAGDAILFRLGPGFEHYVTPVTGTVTKMALAGWFQRTPKALAAFKEAVGH